MRDSRIAETRIENALGRGQVVGMEVISFPDILQPVKTIDWNGYSRVFVL
jgi:hypothetical protein